MIFSMSDYEINSNFISINSVEVFSQGEFFVKNNLQLFLAFSKFFQVKDLKTRMFSTLEFGMNIFQKMLNKIPMFSGCRFREIRAEKSEMFVCYQILKKSDAKISKNQFNFVFTAQILMKNLKRLVVKKDVLKLEGLMKIGFMKISQVYNNYRREISNQLSKIQFLEMHLLEISLLQAKMVVTFIFTTSFLHQFLQIKRMKKLAEVIKMDAFSMQILSGNVLAKNMEANVYAN